MLKLSRIKPGTHSYTFHIPLMKTKSFGQSFIYTYIQKPLEHHNHTKRRLSRAELLAESNRDGSVRVPAWTYRLDSTQPSHLIIIRESRQARERRCLFAFRSQGRQGTGRACLWRHCPSEVCRCDRQWRSITVSVDTVRVVS